MLEGDCAKYFDGESTKNIGKKCIPAKLEAILQDERHQVIGTIFSKNWRHGKYFTARHFMAAGMAKSTIYDILHRWETGLTMKRTAGSGRKRYKFNGKVRGPLVGRNS